jgi:hypothetical protein
MAGSNGTAGHSLALDGEGGTCAGDDACPAHPAIRTGVAIARIASGIGQHLPAPARKSPAPTASGRTGRSRTASASAGSGHHPVSSPARSHATPARTPASSPCACPSPIAGRAISSTREQERPESTAGRARLACTGAVNLRARNHNRRDRLQHRRRTAAIRSRGCTGSRSDLIPALALVARGRSAAGAAAGGHRHYPAPKAAFGRD